MIVGIDSSNVAGNRRIDWTKAKAEGSIGFAFLRATFGADEDRQFRTEWPKLRDAGIVRGAYVFLRFPRADVQAPDISVQVKVATTVIGKLSKDDLPPVLDVEFPGGREATGLSAAECLHRVMEAWHGLADAYGTPPIVYTSERVWREDLNNLNEPILGTSPLWLARYPFKPGPPARDAQAFAGGRLDPPVPPPWVDHGNWWFHQYQGDAQGFPGFTGKVDMNRFNTMARGAQGARVRWVQSRLISGSTSGMFDASLEADVRAFQRRNELAPDGIIGPKTFARLCW